MHGVEGHCGLPYMLDTAEKFSEAGHTVVLFNHYCVPGEKNQKLFSFVDPHDTNEVIAFIRKQFENFDLYLVGFSLGGNHALSYVGKAAQSRMEGNPIPNDQS
jgi:uncharacterized protein